MTSSPRAWSVLFTGFAMLSVVATPPTGCASDAVKAAPSADATADTSVPWNCQALWLPTVVDDVAAAAAETAARNRDVLKDANPETWRSFYRECIADAITSRP